MMLFPGGRVSPEELAKLHRVCKAVCSERKISLESGRGARIAAHIIKLFMNGLTEENELLDTMRHRELYGFH